MKYNLLYQKIVNKALKRNWSRKYCRTQNIYVEKHHIIPKCLGGTDDIENLVLLTAKEHFICHKLLRKIYPNDKKLSFAVWNMIHCVSEGQERSCIASSKLYEKIRKDVSQHISETRKGIPQPKIQGERNGMYGVHRFGESNPNYGKRLSDEAKKKISLANTGRKWKEHQFEDHKKRMEKFWSNEENRKICSERMKSREIKPPSFKGTKWYNNGITEIRTKNAPPEGYIPGRIIVFGRKVV